jgi:hypothetical protein
LQSDWLGRTQKKIADAHLNGLSAFVFNQAGTVGSIHKAERQKYSILSTKNGNKIPEVSIILENGNNF